MNILDNGKHNTLKKIPLGVARVELLLKTLLMVYESYSKYMYVRESVIYLTVSLYYI